MLTLTYNLDAFLSDIEHAAYLRPNTIDSYRYDLCIAAAELTSPLDQLTLTEIEAFLADRCVVASTQARRAASLRRFFKSEDRMNAKQWMSLLPQHVSPIA